MRSATGGTRELLLLWTAVVAVQLIVAAQSRVNAAAPLWGQDPRLLIGDVSEDREDQDQDQDQNLEDQSSDLLLANETQLEGAPQLLARPEALYFVSARLPVELSCVAEPVSHASIFCADRVWPYRPADGVQGGSDVGGGGQEPPPSNVADQDDDQLRVVRMDSKNRAHRKGQRWRLSVLITRAEVERYLAASQPPAVYSCFCEVWNPIIQLGRPKKIRSPPTIIKPSYIKEMFRLDPVSVQAQVGQDVVLKCLAPESQPGSHVTWLKDGQLLNLHKQAFRMRMVAHFPSDSRAPSTLTVSRLDEQDSGRYQCLATSLGVERLSAEAVLSVVPAVMTSEGADESKSLKKWWDRSSLNDPAKILVILLSTVLLLVCITVMFILVQCNLCPCRQRNTISSPCKGHSSSHLKCSRHHHPSHHAAGRGDHPTAAPSSCQTQGTGGSLCQCKCRLSDQDQPSCSEDSLLESGGGMTSVNGGERSLQFHVACSPADRECNEAAPISSSSNNSGHPAPMPGMHWSLDQAFYHAPSNPGHHHHHHQLVFPQHVIGASTSPDSGVLVYNNNQLPTAANHPQQLHHHNHITSNANLILHNNNNSHMYNLHTKMASPQLSAFVQDSCQSLSSCSADFRKSSDSPVGGGAWPDDRKPVVDDRLQKFAISSEDITWLQHRGDSEDQLKPTHKVLNHTSEVNNLDYILTLPPPFVPSNREVTNLKR